MRKSKKKKPSAEQWGLSPAMAALGAVQDYQAYQRTAWPMISLVRPKKRGRPSKVEKAYDRLLAQMSRKITKHMRQPDVLAAIKKFQTDAMMLGTGVLDTNDLRLKDLK